MDILALLKEGATREEIERDFADEMAEALLEYEKYQKEQEELARKEAARKMELEFRKKRQSEARKALGAAIIEYFDSLDMVVEEETIDAVDWIIDVLPQIKVVKTGGRFW